jgi:hypothetical protein
MLGVLSFVGGVYGEILFTLFPVRQKTEQLNKRTNILHLGITCIERVPDSVFKQLLYIRHVVTWCKVFILKVKIVV